MLIVMSLIHNTQFNAAIALFIVANLLQISLSVSPSSCISDPKYLKFETFFLSLFLLKRNFFFRARS